MKNFLPKTLQSALLCLLIAAMFALVVRVFVSTGRLESRVGETTSAAQTLVLEAQGFIAGQRGLAEENRKSLEAAYQVGAVFNGTGRLLNRSVLPRVMKNLDSADVLLATLNENAVTLNKTIANLDTRVSGKEGVLDAAIALIRGLESTAVTLGVTTRTAERMIQEIGTKSGMVLDEVWELAADPKLQQLLTNATITSGHIARTPEKVDASVESIRLAMLNAPEIAESLSRIAKTSSKFAKITLLANILAVLSRAFLL
jgi:hypothetical protein